MPKWITAIFVFFLSTTLLTAKAITVEDVIKKHVAVMATEVHKQSTDKAIFTDYVRKGYKATLEGIEIIKGRPCYKISLDVPATNKTYYYIDAKSWYLIRRSAAITDKSPAINDADESGKADFPNNENLSASVPETINN